MAFEQTPTEALIAARRRFARLEAATSSDGTVRLTDRLTRQIAEIDAELSARRADVPHHTNRFNDAAYVASFAS